VLANCYIKRDDSSIHLSISSTIMAAPNVNAPAPNVSYFTPWQNPPAGSAVSPQPDGKPVPKLFQPLKIRGVELQNRIFVSGGEIASQNPHINQGIALPSVSILLQRWLSDALGSCSSYVHFYSIENFKF